MYNLKAIPKYLNGIFLVSLLYVLLHIICFDNMPETFSHADELGNLFYKISLSIISSYIFYFIVVHLKEERDKGNINIFVENEVASIIKKHPQEIPFEKGEKFALSNHKNTTIEIASIIKNIFSVMPFLDTELVKILSKILNSKYCLCICKYNEYGIGGEPIISDINSYKEFHAELKKYYNLKLVQYRKNGQ